MTPLLCIPASIRDDRRISVYVAAREDLLMATKTPTIIWAQRVEKVFITWEMLSTKDVNVTLAEGLLSIEGKDSKGDTYKLENLPLFLEIEPENSKWFKNDR